MYRYFFGLVCISLVARGVERGFELSSNRDGLRLNLRSVVSCLFNCIYAWEIESMSDAIYVS